MTATSVLEDGVNKFLKKLNIFAIMRRIKSDILLKTDFSFAGPDVELFSLFGAVVDSVS